MLDGDERAGVIRVAVGLSEDDVCRIADRTAALLRADGRSRAHQSPYLTVEETAIYLRCRRQRIYDLLSQRRLSRIKDGGRTLISRAELEAYLRRGADEAPSARWNSAA
jgi:excisionase family DNA binding protein